MKYYLIAGEASGDLHASRLMQSLKRQDPEAEFRFFGGDQMASVGGTLVKHYRDLAYMGFIPVLLHLPTILRNMRMCKEDIREWQPHAVILIDYPGFNLKIAKYIKEQGARSKEQEDTTSPNISPAPCPLPLAPQVFYYISPKIWAWKEHRIKNIKRDVDELFSILPFEVDFFEKKHQYPIHYVGNPTKAEVDEFMTTAAADNDSFFRRNDLSVDKPIIAILCGSRQQEIKDNLPGMLEATRHLSDAYQLVVAGAPAIDHEYYQQFTQGYQVNVLRSGQTYQLLFNASAALVTSGTATLETCMFGVPQVVCYNTKLAKLFGFLKQFLSVKYVSLVNLIADREVVTELVADKFSVEAIRRELEQVLPDGSRREQMLSDYAEVRRRLGDSNAPDEAAQTMVKLLIPR